MLSVWQARRQVVAAGSARLTGDRRGHTSVARRVVCRPPQLPSGTSSVQQHQTQSQHSVGAGQAGPSIRGRWCRSCRHSGCAAAHETVRLRHAARTRINGSLTRVAETVGRNTRRALCERPRGPTRPHSELWRPCYKGRSLPESNPKPIHFGTITFLKQKINPKPRPRSRYHGSYRHQR